MAEEIDLGSLNFDTDKLAKSLLETRIQIDQVKEALAENRKEMRDSQKAINNLEKVQRDLKNVGQESSDGYKNITKEINAMKKAQVETTKVIIKQEQEVRTLNKEQQILTKILDANTKATDGNTAAIDRAISASQNEVKTIDQARASNKELLKLRNQLDISGGKNADKLAELNKALDANNKFIKENVSAYEQQKIGIGDYRTAIEEALSGTRLFGVSLSEVKNVAGQFSGVINLIRKDIKQTTDTFKNSAEATKDMSNAQKMAFFTTQSLSAGLKILKVALISTGIGAIVVALGSLITFLSTTQAGIDAVTSVTRPLAAVFQTLLGVIQQFGGDIFKDPLGALKTMYNFVKKQLVESFTSLGKIIEGVFTLNGDLIKEGRDQYAKLAKDNTDAIKNFARATRDEISKAIDAGQKIDQLQKQQEKLESKIASIRAQANDDLRKQENIYKDQTLSMEERNAAADKARQIALDLQDKENEILDIQIEQLKIKQSLNDTSREEEKLLDELIAKRIDTAAKADEIERKTLMLKRQMQNEANAKEKAANDARLAAALELQQIELERFKLLNEGRQDGFDEEIQFVRDISERRLAILEEEFKQGKKSKAAYELEKLQITQQAQQDEADVVLFYSAQRLNKEILDLEKLRSERKRITEDSVQDEIESLEALRVLKANELQVQLDAGIISQREYNAALIELELEKNEQIKEINTAFEAQRKEDEKLSRMLDNEQKLLELRGFMEAEREIERQAYEEKVSELEAQRQEGLISEENYLKSLEVLNEKHAKALDKIDEARFQGKLKMASDTFGNLATIAGEETEAGKFFASTQAAIDTYASAVAAYKSMASIPVVGPALGAAAAAAAIATGLRTVAKINSVDVGFYSGGYTGDGGMFERRGNVHAGEVVFSQADVQLLGGAANVESMRPTSNLFSEMPRGVMQDETDKTAMMAAMIGEAVERGSMNGTSKGVVDAEDNKKVKERARF